MAWQGNHEIMRKIHMQRPLVKELDRSDCDPFEEFTEILDAQLSWLKARKIDTMVLSQPTIWRENLSKKERENLWFPVMCREDALRVDPALLQSRFERWNRHQGEIAVARGATFVPLDKMIPKDGQHFYDDCHFTLLGSQKVASALLPVVSAKVDEKFGRQLVEN